MSGLREKLKGAFEAHEDFHGADECSVLMMSYDREGNWHATDTGPDSHAVDTGQIIKALAELISELSQKHEDQVH